MNQQQTINKLEWTITTNQCETSADLTNKISYNTERLNTCRVENKILKWENEELKECLMQIELAQLGNNVIMTLHATVGWEDINWANQDQSQ